ncbi:CHAT domain-containing protein [Planktothrix mougeotii]|uniref:CHAT domain-containing protein n=1 Tax=Planktothrix mougeotii LEGE 06226 TaxID=1828728 RepID=A0ABR9UJJ9_9CYAN|nr:CHAT domain-containing protein [Planktothrix mougeotii]MBE9146648.1 CHAT domain-containing protein [Planktothrix mougeotii LEGE 06226]
MQVSKFDIDQLAEQLEDQLNKWLNADQFLTIDRILREKFQRSDEIQVIIQSDDINVRRLPWHLWDFFKPYRKAEVALSSPFYDRPIRTTPQRNQIRILSILGDDKGLNLDKDKVAIEKTGAEPVFLPKPNRKELEEQLSCQQGWDILCFSGHSSSAMDGSNGWFYINNTDKITIAELKTALTTAIENGLQIAIFNSCDGLGLANQLATLHIPQIIVMREPVPDAVAQAFLTHFLTAFASGKSFYLSVREAREKLQSLEQHFPCASWLPIICQNPAEIPPTWESLRGISK